MKKLAALLLMLMTAMTTFAQTSTASTEGKLSPAEQSMANANRLVEKNPKNFEAYNALALALSRRARETSDVKFYAQAEEALKKSFATSPDNFEARELMSGCFSENTNLRQPAKKPAGSTGNCPTT